MMKVKLVPGSMTERGGRLLWSFPLLKDIPLWLRAKELLFMNQAGTISYVLNNTSSSLKLNGRCTDSVSKTFVERPVSTQYGLVRCTRCFVSLCYYELSTDVSGISHLKYV
jgi:hypothetical protein